MLPSHEEVDRITPGPTGETLKNLLALADIERRPRVLVEWTETNHLLAFGLQGKVITYNINYINGLQNLLNMGFRHECGHCSPWTVHGPQLLSSSYMPNRKSISPKPSTVKQSHGNPFAERDLERPIIPNGRHGR